MKRVLLAVVAAAALTVVVAPGVALAQDSVTKGVPVAQANAACAGILGKAKPAGFDAAVSSYNTVDNTDDAPFSAIPVEWQRFIIAVEDHADYLEAASLQRAAITCSGASAVFPDLRLATDVEAAICANARVDLISNPTLRARVTTALGTLGRGYQRARSDCAPPATTTPAPTTTPGPTTPAPTTTPGPTTSAPTTTPEVGPFANCDEVRAAGLTGGIPDTHPRFQDSLDSDNDGLGCEPSEGNGSSGGGTDDSVSVVPNDAPETGDGSTESSFAVRAALAAIMANLGAFALVAHRRGVFRP